MFNFNLDTVEKQLKAGLRRGKNNRLPANVIIGRKGFAKDCVAVTYYYTDVVLVFDDRIVIANGGFGTASTRTHITEALRVLFPGRRASVTQEKGVQVFNFDGSKQPLGRELIFSTANDMDSTLHFYENFVGE